MAEIRLDNIRKSFVYLDIGVDEPLILRETGVSGHAPGRRRGVAPVAGHLHRFDHPGRPLVKACLRPA